MHLHFTLTNLKLEEVIFSILLYGFYINLESNGTFQIVTLFFMSWTGDITAAFEKHLATFGGLDICINSAGIGTSTPFDKDQTNGTHTWRKTINVNLVAVIDCTRLAVCFES